MTKGFIIWLFLTHLIQLITQLAWPSWVEQRMLKKGSNRQFCRAVLNHCPQNKKLIFYYSNQSHKCITPCIVLTECFRPEYSMILPCVREKCLMLIKEEPVSPGVRGRGEGMPLGSCEVCAEPPVLPVAMVQSVLEGRGSGSGERRAKRSMMDRSEQLSTSVVDRDFLLEFI